MTDAFRPKTLSEYHGQNHVKLYLEDLIPGCKEMGQPLPHMLILGMSGTGKTTLAQIVANMMEVPMDTIFAPEVENWDDLAEKLTSRNEYHIVFIDEIHTLSKKLQQRLLRLMESGIYERSEPGTGYTWEEQAVPFTVIAATTHEGNLMPALLSRFKYRPTLNPYSLEQLTEMLQDAAMRNYNTVLPRFIAESLAVMSQMIARRAYNLLEMLMPIVQRRGMNAEALERTMISLEIDPIIGLDRASRQYLMALAKHQGQPMGAETLAKLIGKDEASVTQHIEPFLMSDELRMVFTYAPLGQNMEEPLTGALVTNTRQGRVITSNGLEYLRVCGLLQFSGWFEQEKLTW